jgi:hypothetical protein
MSPKTDSQNIDPDMIEGVLCSKYRGLTHIISTCTAAAAIAGVFMYSEYLQEIPKDYISIVILAALVVGWLFLSIERGRANKRAKTVAKILRSKNIKPTYDPETGMVVLNAIESLTFGNQSTEAVVATESLTREEAAQINDLLAIARAKGSLLLPSGS